MDKIRRRIRKAAALTVATVIAVTAAVSVPLFTGDIPAEVEAAGRPVSIASCVLSGSNVVCNLKSASVPRGDDGKYYVYANEVYEDGPIGEIVATVNAGKDVSVSFPLNYNTEDSNLSRKFLIAMKQGGEMVQVSDEHYITNPEAMAAHGAARMTGSIKGIFLAPKDAFDGHLQDLGVKQVAINMDIGLICSSPAAGKVDTFDYNGQTYYFDANQIHGYDDIFRKLNKDGIQVTVTLLNGGEGAYGQDLIHPLAVGGSCPGYAINTADEAGTNHLKAIGAFLGQRYSGAAGCGQVDNWVIGNEVNARTEWWYTDTDSLDVNVNTYVKAFRILYNEIKSNNASAWLYNSIDQEWNRKSNPGSFLAKEYLDQFNYYMLREGNIDWNLSFHPYNSPLYDPYAWNGQAVWVKRDLSTPYITMQNIDLLVNYMHQDKFLSPSGQVRSISLSEIGYTSAFGTEAQEASIVYGYLKAASLPDIDAFMLFRRQDNAHELETNLAFGLYDLSGNKKPAYDIYKNLGSANEAAAKARASAIIGMDVDQMIAENIVWTRSE